MTACKTGAVFDTLRSVCSSMSLGWMASREASRWSLGRDDDERFPGDNFIDQVWRLRLGPQKSRIEFAPHQSIREVGGILARDCDLDVGQLVAKNAHHLRQPVDFLASQKPDGESRLAGFGSPPRRFA